MLHKNGIKNELKRESILVSNGMNQINENSICVTLGNTIKVYNSKNLDITEDTPTIEMIIPEDGLILQPNELYIGRTFEYTETYGFVPYLSEMDDLASKGIGIHITAGFGDNGFEGTWTLEIFCFKPVKIYPYMPIGQIEYYPLIGDADIEYRGKYYRQVEPTSSRLHQEYSNKLIRKLVNNVNK